MTSPVDLSRVEHVGGVHLREVDLLEGGVGGPLLGPGRCVRLDAVLASGDRLGECCQADGLLLAQHLGHVTAAFVAEYLEQRRQPNHTRLRFAGLAFGHRRFRTRGSRRASDSAETALSSSEWPSSAVGRSASRSSAVASSSGVCAGVVPLAEDASILAPSLGVVSFVPVVASAGCAPRPSRGVVPVSATSTPAAPAPASRVAESLVGSSPSVLLSGDTPGHLRVCLAGYLGRPLAARAAVCRRRSVDRAGTGGGRRPKRESPTSSVNQARSPISVSGYARIHSTARKPPTSPHRAR